MPDINIGILASGRGSNLQAILDAIEKGEIKAKVRIVLSDKKDAPARSRAQQAGILGTFLDPKNFGSREAYDEKIVNLMKENHVELIILAGYMRIITPQLIKAYKNRIMNVHPSLLPSFPGLRAQKKTLQWGTKISGCTVHFVEETVDQGPIIIQAAVSVKADDTEASLASRILEQEHRILPQAIQYYAEGRLRVVGRCVYLKDEDLDQTNVVISPALNPKR